jgi:hypothetical protein
MPAKNRRPYTYTVVLAGQVAEIPPETMHELRLVLTEIGAACEAVSPTSVFWVSVAGSDLIVDLGSWRVTYSIDRGSRTITVKGCKPLP